MRFPWGAAATALAVTTLWVMKWADVHIPRKHRAMLTIKTAHPPPPDLAKLIAPLGFETKFRGLSRSQDEQSVISFEIAWTRTETGDPPVDLVELLEEHYPVGSFELRLESRG